MIAPPGPCGAQLMMSALMIKIQKSESISFAPS